MKSARQLDANRKDDYVFILLYLPIAFIGHRVQITSAPNILSRFIEIQQSNRFTAKQGINYFTFLHAID